MHLSIRQNSATFDVSRAFVTLVAAKLSFLANPVSIRRFLFYNWTKRVSERVSVMFTV